MAVLFVARHVAIWTLLPASLFSTPHLAARIVLTFRTQALMRAALGLIDRASNGYPSARPIPAGKESSSCAWPSRHARIARPRRRPFSAATHHPITVWVGQLVPTITSSRHGAQTLCPPRKCMKERQSPTVAEGVPARGDVRAVESAPCVGFVCTALCLDSMPPLILYRDQHRRCFGA